MDEFTEDVNNRLQNILNWCNCNKLSLHPLKSELMVVKHKRKETHPQLFIDADLIEELNSFKYLGFYMGIRSAEVQCRN